MCKSAVSTWSAILASSLSERQAGLKPKTPITIAPNPNDGSFMLRFEGRPVKNGTFILVDMYGKELLNSPIHTLGYDDIFIDATAIKNGMYYAKIMEGQYAIWESKIIILEK